MVNRPKSSSLSSSSGIPVLETLRSTANSASDILRSTRSSPLRSSPLTKVVVLPEATTIDHGDEEPKVSRHPPSDLPGSRRRGLSTSTIRPNHPDGAIPVSRVTSNPLPSVQPTTPDFASLGVADAGSSARSRSSSTTRGRPLLRESIFTWRVRARRSETPPNGVPRTWWSSGETEARPWMEPEKRKSVPPEQAEGWIRTRDVSGQFCRSPRANQVFGFQT